MHRGTRYSCNDFQTKKKKLFSARWRYQTKYDYSSMKQFIHQLFVFCWKRSLNLTRFDGICFFFLLVQRRKRQLCRLCTMHIRPQSRKKNKIRTTTSNKKKTRRWKRKNWNQKISTSMIKVIERCIICIASSAFYFQY